MRTTLNIDDDLIAAAKIMAHAQSTSVGKVLSDWARRGLGSAPRIKAGRAGELPVFCVSANARPITLQDVKREEDEA